MEQTSSSLKYQTISESTKQIVDYIDNRRNFKTFSLKTKWEKFNRLCMGGLEPNALYTIAGISGSGKSSFVNNLESDIFEMNPKAQVAVLNMSFEMISAKQVGRKLSYKLNKTTSELYTGNYKEPLNDEDFKQVQEAAETIKDLPIYYVDTPGTVEQIRKTILHFMNNEGKGKWVIVILDHVLLTKGRTGEGERQMASDLQRTFIELKKYGRTTIIQLSQLNRNIESSDRIANNSMHYPMRKDIFASDSIYHASDYLMILHCPEKLGIEAYGLKGLPVKDLIYLHLQKNRDGQVGILVFENNLKYNHLVETDVKDHLKKEDDINLQLKF